jgi:peptide/nickel transport system substrate-binding protein
VLVGLSYADDKGDLHPRLAEAVPTIENGGWRVFPDGRMETTWKLRPNVRWHDGAPLTTADLVFGATVEQDPELPIAQHPAYPLIESIEAADASTIAVRWKQPYIQADSMFSYELALPLPKHLLEQTYADDKAGFTDIEYWSARFVGSGPYRVRDWVVDSHVVVQAFDGYVLGRPKIDEIEVRFIVDGSTVGANILANAVDVILGRTLMPVDQAQDILQRRRDLKTERALRSWYPVHAQFINTSPPVVADVRFRRALLHAIDRQQMIEALGGGISPIAHSIVGPDIAEYREIQGSEVRYDFDLQRATQMVQDLGYAKGPDGTFVDPSGQKLGVSIWTTTRSEIQPRIVLAVADYWKQLGVDVEPNMIPPQRIGDREYRAQFPAFEMVSGTNGVSSEEIRRMLSSSTPLPENRFTATGNNSRYRNPENDALIERYLTTIPRDDRMQALRELIHHRTDQLPSMGLLYEVEFTIYYERLSNVTSRGPRSAQTWNAHLWELRR